jgi:coenzyme F420-reducing hydrogenase delta subunit
MDDLYEPKILSFCCRWCSYAAADLAGSMRIQYPPNVRIVMVPCTGRIDVLHLLHAIETGADGLFLSGCLIGDCHYLTGNQKATKRVASVKKALQEIGVEPERVEIYYNSSAMGPQFAESCREFTERIKRLGPVFPSRNQQRTLTSQADGETEKRAASL